MPGKGDFPRPCRVCRFCSEIAMEPRNVKQENPEEHPGESWPGNPEKSFPPSRRDAEKIPSPPCILVRFEVVASPRIGAGRPISPGACAAVRSAGLPHTVPEPEAPLQDRISRSRAAMISFSVLQGLRAETYRILNVPCDNRRFPSLQLPNNFACCFWRLGPEGEANQG